MLKETVKKKNNKWLYLIPVVAILILAAVLECFIFNKDYFFEVKDRSYVIDLSSCETNGLITDGSHYISTTNDPWIAVYDINDNIKNIQINMSTKQSGTSLQVFYTNEQYPTFTESLSVATSVTPGSDGYLLKIDSDSAIKDLRIDLVDKENIDIILNSIKINVNTPFVFAIFRFLLVLGVLSTVYFAILMIIKYRKESDIGIEKLFLICAVIFGLLFCAFDPPLESSDEAAHFIKAYNISMLQFGSTETNHVKVPEGFGEFINNNNNLGRSFFGVSTYQDFVKRFEYFLKMDSSLKTDGFFKSSADQYPFYMHIFAAIGIKVGMLMNLPLIFVFYFGRLFNLAAYITIIYFAIKLAPIGKRIIFMCALLPTAIYHASAISGDGVFIALACLFLSYILYERNNKDAFSIPSIIIGALLAILLCMAKTGTYSLIAFSYLLLPKTEFKTKKCLYLYRIVMAMLIIAASSYTLISQMSVLQVQGNEHSQIKYIIFSPFSYLGVIYNTFKQNFIFYLQTLILGWDTPVYMNTVILFFVLFIALADKDKEGLVPLECKDKILFFILSIISIIVIETALYVTFTEYRASTVGGVNARYFLPLLPFILISIKNKFIEFRPDAKWLDAIATIVMSSALLFQLFTLYTRYFI